jgi:hypothetical protein
VAALSALADAVKRQAANIDVSGPGITLPAGRARPPGKSEGAGSTAPQSRTTGAPEEIQERSVAAEEGHGDGEAAPPRSVSEETEALVEKLNRSARDLVWAVEGALPRDVEDRYRSGQSHLYVRRLYEDGGRKMVEAVEGRYQAEKLMRGRVDAFTRLFERLLDTVSNAPQSEPLVDACLASDSGKLYLMLATASGRITPH